MKEPHDSVAQGTYFFMGVNGPHRAVSADGYDLLYYFPLALRGNVLVSLSQPLVRISHELTRRTGGPEPRRRKMGIGGTYYGHFQA